MKGKFDKGKLDPSVNPEYYASMKDPVYNKNSHNQPEKRMGSGSFANLPDEPIMRNYSRSHNMRSGVINAYECGLEDDTGIHENRP